MNTIQRTFASIPYSIASRLDAWAVWAAKHLPIDGAGVVYWRDGPWGVRFGKQGTSRFLQVGGYEVCIDFRTPGKALVSAS
ncbi:hypothetical protein [Rhodoferax fermentans]|uniref:Uncharacterized protein n=1 Tax=Rhodoferax fermentans TaxID=28066 RepID=A0A1T1AWM4_RHOFE|nr:hypothetical protein [Rhodoferax fermentans]MBK1684845.1 hypothetical protein [Rhodoferax fermentans]OOV08457.1 hypothetical protein RF819_18710 [Rhodoferax fermentans]